MKVDFMPYGSPEGRWSFNIVGLDSWRFGMIIAAMDIAAASEFADSPEFRALSQSIHEQSDGQVKAYTAELREYRGLGISK
jgi:hypothetical protein